MHDSMLQSGWAVAMVGIPAILLLMLSLFRVDEMFAAPKERPQRRRTFATVRHGGQDCLCDPDGKPWDQDLNSL